MRLVVLKFAYPTYIRRWYATRPGEEARSFADQQAALHHDSFWWGGVWSGVLPDQGIEVTEITMNAEGLQRAWAREHGLALGQVGWMADVLRQQIAAARPDALFIQSFKGLSPELLASIRAERPELRAVVGWVGSPHAPPALLAACDHIVTCVPELVAELRSAGHSCSHMNHAFDPAVSERIGEPAGDEIAFSFLGAVANRREHGQRADLIRTVAARTPLQVFADLPATLPRRVAGWAVARSVYAVGAGLRRLGVGRDTLLTVPVVRHTATWPSNPRFTRAPAPRRRLNRPVYGLEMFATLRRSRVTLNAHSTVSPLSMSNLRTFEATGIGTCLLTDWRPNVGELFEPGTEVVTYGSADECVEQAEWLLEHPADAARIAAAARRRVLREHTFAHRAPTLAAALRAAVDRSDRRLDRVGA